MGLSYGDWSRILIHDLSSSNLCSEQTLGAFQYTMSTDKKLYFLKQISLGVGTESTQLSFHQETSFAQRKN